MYTDLRWTDRSSSTLNFSAKFTYMYINPYLGKSSVYWPLGTQTTSWRDQLQYHVSMFTTSQLTMPYLNSGEMYEHVPHHEDSLSAKILNINNSTHIENNIQSQ